MKVAVITPCHDESEKVLARCLDSVRGQTVRAVHIVVSDGVERDLSRDHVEHIRLPISHHDYGDTPRLIGTISAWSQGYDAVMWLDADNWFEHDHVEKMIATMEVENAHIVTSRRVLRRPDGSVLGPCHESDGVGFNDTNCYLVRRSAMLVSLAWFKEDRRLGVVGDRFVWRAALDSKLKVSRSPRPTVNYTTRIAGHYLERGEQPPADARVIVMRDGVWTSVPWMLIGT